MLEVLLFSVLDVVEERADLRVDREVDAVGRCFAASVACQAGFRVFPGGEEVIAHGLSGVFEAGLTVGLDEEDGGEVYGVVALAVRDAERTAILLEEEVKLDRRFARES